MTELQHCVNETLRMYPPLIMLMRMALKDIEFEGGNDSVPAHASFFDMPISYRHGHWETYDDS